VSGYLCIECGWTGPTPCTTWLQMGGRPRQAINCCPECMGINTTIEPCCDEPGCTEPSSCGTPTAAGGYKRHCHNHPPANPRPRPTP
jgi:hypothetical protein